MTLSARTQAIKRDGRRALVPFFTAGYPDEAVFLDCVRAAAAAGADAIEIGVPFSDPIADGPVIQAASTAALAAGMTLMRALELAADVSGDIDVPLVAMTYINPILSYGTGRFAADAHGAGIRGLIAPDVSFEECAEVRDTVRAAGIDYVHLLAPTSDDARVEKIAADASGFVYLVSLTGVTGARDALAADLPEFVGRVRPRTDAPLYVGFGVSTPEHARTVAESADGVIIGSRLIRLIDEGTPAGAAGRVGAFLTSVRRALDGNSQETPD